MSDHDKLLEIHRLLDEAYRNYFEKSDGYCKSSEGHVEVSYGNYWDRMDEAEPLKIGRVSVYSYVFGPHRQHDFGSLDEALAAVRKWHGAEMAHDYSAETGW